MQWVPRLIYVQVNGCPYTKDSKRRKEDMVFGNAQGLEMLADALGSLKGVYWRGDCNL